jgi:hypothetical protein
VGRIIILRYVNYQPLVCVVGNHESRQKLKKLFVEKNDIMGEIGVFHLKQ